MLRATPCRSLMIPDSVPGAAQFRIKGVKSSASEGVTTAVARAQSSSKGLKLFLGEALRVFLG